MARVSMGSLRATLSSRWRGWSMTTEWELGGYNLFNLSAHTVFPFGGPRVGMTMEWESGGPNRVPPIGKRCVRLRRPQGCDGAHARTLSELGKLSRADLVRLPAGLGRHGHSTVYRSPTTVCGADAASVADQGDTRL